MLFLLEVHDDTSLYRIGCDCEIYCVIIDICSWIFRTSVSMV